MKKYHGYSLEELESMLPWERMIHVDKVKAILREEYERAREEQHRKRNQ
jgi:hypothetical protein